MPICFVSCGVMFVFVLFGVFNSNFLGSKFNFSLTLLYLAFQIFSFFIKDITIFSISITYFIPLVYISILTLTNLKKINMVKIITLSLIIATMLIAIGFVDTAFANFIEQHFILVCLIGALISFIVSKNVTEALISCVLGYTIFIVGITFKKSITLNLTNITVLNCITTSMLLILFMQVAKNIFSFILRRTKNEKFKKI